MMTMTVTRPVRLVEPPPVPWQCGNCPQILGMVRGDRVIIRHSKRQIETRLPCSQVCDKCGALNVLDTAPERC